MGNLAEAQLLELGDLFFDKTALEGGEVAAASALDVMGVAVGLMRGSSHVAGDLVREKGAVNEALLFKLLQVSIDGGEVAAAVSQLTVKVLGRERAEGAQERIHDLKALRCFSQAF